MQKKTRITASLSEAEMEKVFKLMALYKASNIAKLMKILINEK